MDDIDILNDALTLEHLEYAFYRDGLAGTIRHSGQRILHSIGMDAGTIAMLP